MHSYIKLLAVALMIPFIVFSQDNYVISDPIDLYEGGWNEVLQAENGNTLLFHFEPQKAILVKVFDSSHKEIASTRNITKLVDLNLINHAYFKGIYAMNGEAVLFLTQEYLVKMTTFRIRINTSTGKIITEEVLAKVQDKKDGAKVILVNNALPGYNVLHYPRPLNDYGTWDFRVDRYNEKHELIREVTAHLAFKGNSSIEIVGCHLDKSGSIFFAAYIPDSFYLAIYALPHDGNEFISKVVRVSPVEHDYSAKFSQNPFDKKLNILLCDAVEGAIKPGTFVERKFDINDYTFITISEDFESINALELNNTMVNNYLQSHTDSLHMFFGNVFAMLTNDYGLTTTIANEENIFRYSKFMDRISTRYFAVRHYNDKGEEVAATVLPRSNLRAIEGNYPAVFNGKSAEFDLIYGSVINYKNSVYILFNDPDKNFNLELTPASDSVFRNDVKSYSYLLTNAMFYKINRKKEIEKQYLLGVPDGTEYKHIYASTVDINQQTGLLAVLLQRTKGDKNTMHLAWKQL